VGLSGWYLVQPRPLIVQGEADSTRIDMAARVDGRVGEIPVVRGEDVAAGTPLVRIENPELLAKLQEARASKGVAEAELARVNAGTRQEIVAVRKAEIDRADAALTLARQTYERTKQLAVDKFASQAKLDEAVAELQLAQRGYDQAKLSYAEAVAGFTREEHEMAEAKVKKAEAAVATLQALVDQLVVTAPTASQVYQLDIEAGEVVAPGIPLLALVDLGDVWLRFDLREDLVRGLKVGDRFDARIPALGDRPITAEVKLIAAKGEYAGWRATRATGDFDLRTFQIRAYPVEKIPGLRPGMSAYVDWRGREFR
jgi:HlyD family secretion protein